MNRIRPWLYIGKYRDTLNYTVLQAHNIGAMLLLAEPVDQPGIISCYLAVEDGVPLPDNALRQGVDFVSEQRRQGRTVLIACGAGHSRSVVFGIASLKEEEGLSLLGALQVIGNQHPDALPHMALWESLCHYYQEDISFFTMLDTFNSKK